MNEMANDKQVGGTHYKTNSVQHWDIVYTVFGGDYLVGNATKYLARLGKKGDLNKSIEDIEKAIHYLEKKREQMIVQSAVQRLEDDDGGPTSGYVNQDR